jgi:hypothetical protein
MLAQNYPKAVLLYILIFIVHYYQQHYLRSTADYDLRFCWFIPGVACVKQLLE